MDKRKLCIIFCGILGLLSIVSSFVSISINLLMGILSLVVLIISSLYSKEYKNINGSSPKGIGLIDFGVLFNLIGGILFGSFNTMGSLCVIIGLIILLFNKNN